MLAHFIPFREGVFGKKLVPRNTPRVLSRDSSKGIFVSTSQRILQGALMPFEKCRKSARLFSSHPGAPRPALFASSRGAFQHAADHDSQPPFQLPKSWTDRKAQLNLSTPFDFVNTADIIGGNSGSPVVNRAGELVGIIFDGNIQSLVLDYNYSDKQARAVAVHAAGIAEALRKAYGADRLLSELGLK